MKKNALFDASRFFLNKLYVPAARCGTPPGTPIYTGEQTETPIRIQTLRFSADQFEEQEHERIETALDYLEAAGPAWINIDGLHQPEIISRVGERVALHPLVVEDILHTHQRPKLEEHEQVLYLVLRMLSMADNGGVQAEQVSFVLTESTLITFQESPGDVFDPVRERIRKKQGRIRKMGADYLLYSLLDAVVDHYFVVLEQFGERIESIELALMNNPDPQLLHDMHALKRELLFIRRAIWPLRELVGTLERAESPFIQESLQVYLRDLYDHTIQVADTVESLRDLLSSVQDLYLSSLGNKTNQVMQVLTIIATIFIPITFVAGIYGMNFEVMPELKWRYGYAAVWALMLVMTVGMLILFYRKRWITIRSTPRK